jgi:hypothetical protein
VIGTYASAILIAAVALVLGRGICVLCGNDGRTWLAGPVGLAALLAVCNVAVKLPGHGPTAVVVLVILFVAAVCLGVRRGAGWPPLADGVPVAIGILAFVSVPFLTEGRVGILGVSYDNDTHWHLILAQGLLHPSIQPVDQYGAGYPLGPHAIAAVFAELLGSRVDQTLTGLLMATPVLTAWAALGALSDVGRTRRWLVAGLAGVAYLVVASYVTSAFKEPILASLLLGVVLALQAGSRDRFARPVAVIVPLAVLVAGILYDYSYPGIVWPVAVLAVWLVAEFFFGGVWRRLGHVAARALASWRILAGGLLVLLLVVAPELHQIHGFYIVNKGTSVGTAGGIELTGPLSLGILAQPLHALEGLNIWVYGDYRFPPPALLTPGLLAGISLIVLVGGLASALARGERVLPATVAGLILVWLYTKHSQSPYVVSKAMVVAAPFVMLCGGGELVRRLEGVRVPSWPALAMGGLAFVYFYFALTSSFLVLRDAEVDPVNHFNELRALRPVLHDRPTLAMFYDDYAQWELLGVPERMPQQGATMVTRTARPWSYGQPYQFDSFTPAQLDQFTYVITSRTLAQSQPPPNFHVVARSNSYEVWHRVGPTPRFNVLFNATGQPGATLDCRTPAGRSIARRGASPRCAGPRSTAPSPGFNRTRRRCSRCASPPGHGSCRCRTRARKPWT